MRKHPYEHHDLTNDGQTTIGRMIDRLLQANIDAGKTVMEVTVSLNLPSQGLPK